MKVLIIEDETAAYNNIRNLLLSINPEIEILDNPDTVVASVAWFRSHPAPDLVFMDIQLADGSAFSIFEHIEVEAPIVFTTAYDEHAIQAFRVNSIDYVLKPITNKNLRNALAKFEQMNRLSYLQNRRNIEHLTGTQTHLRHLLIPLKDSLVPVKTEQIVFIYNTNGNTEVVTEDKQAYRIEKSLDSMMQKLDTTVFFRANRQFIVSKEFIKEIKIWFNNRLLLRLSVETPEPVFVSKNRVTKFKSWFS